MVFEILEKVTLNYLCNDVSCNSCSFYCTDLKHSKSKLYTDLNSDVFDKEIHRNVTHNKPVVAVLRFTTR